MNIKEIGNNSIEKIIGSSISDEKDGRFRVKLFYPLVSDMKIESINGKKADVNDTKVLIDNIGPSGLKFISNLVLPVKPEIMFNFGTIILNETIYLSGKIVWKEESVNGLYEYGIKFFHNDEKDQYLIRVFNTLQINMRKSPIVSGCNFCTDDITSFFLNMNINMETDINTDLIEVKNLIIRNGNEVINRYKELLEIYRKYKGNEEIEGSIINFVGKVKQIVNKFTL
ncbi:MAG TPA: PilZ domain-containing protein [Clostridiaceae bacterium]